MVRFVLNANCSLLEVLKIVKVNPVCYFKSVIMMKTLQHWFMFHNFFTVKKQAG